MSKNKIRARKPKTTMPDEKWLDDAEKAVNDANKDDYEEAVIITEEESKIEEDEAPEA